MVEKPIGYDLESALALDALLADNFEESQIFRIDHYLGKETVQNLLAFRFANPLFEPLWNRRYIDCVTITAVEAVGVELRGGYYDHAGALRDMVQNHLMQLLCLVAMEPMVSFEADEIRNKKVDVLHAVRPFQRDSVHQSVVRGQYGPGWVEGKKVPGYREEEGVSPDSQTETFVALRLFVDNWRWQDVPFYLRTGKRLTRQASEIAIQFRAVPHRSFPPESTLDWQSSRLVISIQPDEGIVLRFQAKHPGPKMHLRPVEMQFNYQDTFAVQSPEAYETLLWDVMKNDATLFMRADQVEAAWRLLMPVIEAWAMAPPGDFPNYAAGTWGPEDAQRLLAQGHSWPLPTELVVQCERNGKNSRHEKIPHEVVFLFDVDNTLLDNDRVLDDLRNHLEREFGAEARDRYFAIMEEFFAELGYADYLGALQRYRLEDMCDLRLLLMSSFLVDYPFANRLYPGSPAALAHVRAWGATVILSDGDVVFQPRKIQRFWTMGSGRGPCADLRPQRADAGRRRAALPCAALRHGGR